MLFHFYFYFGSSSRSSKQLRSADWQRPGWESHHVSGDTGYCWRVYFPLVLATESWGSNAEPLSTAERLQEQSCHRHKVVKGVSHWNAQHLHPLLSSVEWESILLLEKKTPEHEHISRKWHLNYVDVSAFVSLKLLIWILHHHCDLKNHTALSLV